MKKRLSFAVAVGLVSASLVFGAGDHVMAQSGKPLACSTTKGAMERAALANAFDGKTVTGNADAVLAALVVIDNTQKPYTRPQAIEQFQKFAAASGASPNADDCAANVARRDAFAKAINALGSAESLSLSTRNRQMDLDISNMSPPPNVN